MAQYTPMIQQYLAIKAQVPDALLFFRLGDFYEMFFEDAIEASRELEITLTGREGGSSEKIPMCGVPYHAAEGYLSRLVDKGYKVAICEQVEDPSEAKGIVRREIIRIVTPGTVMESKLLGESTNNYMLSLTQADDEGFGLTACDISTGELHVTLLTSGVEQLLDEINVYSPSELIGRSELLTMIQERLPVVGKPIVYTVRDSQYIEVREQMSLFDHFPALEVAALSGTAKQSVLTLLAYLQETQKRSLTHFKRIRLYEQEQYMTMDPFTRRNLELTETVRERSKKGSLLWLIDGTVTAMGARMLRRWMDKPLLSKERIEERLEAVERMHRDLIAREDVRSALKEVYDLERLVARISYGNANARDMVALKLSLQQVPLLKEACVNSGSETLTKLAESMDTCEDIKTWIEKAIVDEPPVSIRDGGMIRSGLDEYLDKLKEASTNGKRWIAELEVKEREITGIKSLKVGFNKVFGYYLEVTKSNISSLPEGRYERKQTLANAERFITPELKEQETLILEAEDKMFDLELQLFGELRVRICEHISRLQGLAERIASVDILQGFAHISAANHYTRPTITDGYDLNVKEGRHPVVEAVIERKAFIANDTAMVKDEGRMLLITGPNMAGKSTYMRQVAILTIMAQIGCFVPAQEAIMPLVDRIFTRIGAADDLIGGQSTFMVEMMDIQTMTAKATPRSLVIIDELGRGTSTGEGMAIAQAVIEHLHHHVGCKTLVSTHFHELAHLEQSLMYLRNYCMAVKESDAGVTFLRKLIPGAASTSYGIYCAELAGLPDTIISRSYDLLQAFETRAGLLEAAVGGTEVPAAHTVVSTSAEVVHAAPTSANQQEIDSTVTDEPSSGLPIEQLSLFESNETTKPKQSNHHDAMSNKQLKVIEQLKGVDLINMTPLQALNLIYDLKQRL